MIKESAFLPNRKTLIVDVTDIPNGVYFLKIESGDKSLGILKVVVK
jgi:hypothetical protein